MFGHNLREIWEFSGWDCLRKKHHLRKTRNCHQQLRQCRQQALLPRLHHAPLCFVVESPLPRPASPLDIIVLSYSMDGVLTNEHFEANEPSYVCFLQQQGTKATPSVLFDFQAQLQKWVHEQATAAAASGQNEYPTTVRDLPVVYNKWCFLSPPKHPKSNTHRETQQLWTRTWGCLFSCWHSHHDEIQKSMIIGFCRVLPNDSSVRKSFMILTFLAEMMCDVTFSFLC